jgi:hypothetical protein
MNVLVKVGNEMAEINQGSGVKTIAFYLPQYHTIPENDKWWGEGFTEWTNTKKAKPLFEGHYQPKTPLNHNYYDLMKDESVMIEQSKLAKKYGVWGFCYYHYWFKNGKKLLEKPVERMLVDGRVDIPFCLSWANENWTRNWDGGNREIIAEQDYGDIADWEQHFNYLLQFFKDKRYITFDKKPILIIYKPQLIECLNEMLDYWDKRAKQEGLKGLIFAFQFPEWFFKKEYDASRFKYMIKFEPICSGTFMNKQTILRMNMHRIRHIYYRIFTMIFPFHKKIIKNTSEGQKELIKRDYDHVWNTILHGYTSSKMLEGAFTDWDNTARNKTGMLHIGASPDKFGDYMTQLVKKVNKKDKDKVIFINAWNEWGEGCYLEPDEKYGFDYLKKLKFALESNDAFPR